MEVMMSSNTKPRCHSQNLPSKKHISPSAIKGLSEQHCLIPAIFKRSSSERFGDTPSTFLGKLFHQLIEDAGKGINPQKQVKQFKTKTLKGVSARNLFAQNDNRRWQVRKKPFLALAKEAYNPNYITPITTSSNSSFRTINYTQYSQCLSDGSYYEQPIAFQYNGVWLYGIIDHLEIKAKEIIITDFKTGRMVDHEGKTKEGYKIQMLVYGFLASQLYKNRHITLQLKGADLNGQSEIILIDFSLTNVKKLITPMMQEYKDYQSCPVYRPGADCRWCNLRVDCTAYHDEVQSNEWWLLRSPNEFTIPLDVWGIIESINDSGRSRHKHVLIQTDVGPFFVKYIPEESIKNKDVGSFIEVYSMYHPTGTQHLKHLPRELTIGPLNSIEKPWNQSFSYIII